jgi:hypothetical protein
MHILVYAVKSGSVAKQQVLKLWACPPGVLLALWEGRVFCTRDIYFKWNMGVTKIYISVGTLLGWNMKIVLFRDLNFTEVYINIEKFVIP